MFKEGAGMNDLESDLFKIIETSHGTFDCATLVHAYLVKVNYRGDYLELHSRITTCCEGFYETGKLKKIGKNMYLYKST
ncbi:hypothetical protein D3C78_843340 [compost metagenome]